MVHLDRGNYRIAVLPNGDHSFAACVQALKKADTTVHIQALVLTVDDSGSISVNC